MDDNDFVIENTTFSIDRARQGLWKQAKTDIDIICCIFLKKLCQEIVLLLINLLPRSINQKASYSNGFERN